MPTQRPPARRKCAAALLPTALFVAGAALWAGSRPASANDATRRTPIVQAVELAGPAVVNIQGQKSVADAASTARGAVRQVNGMGTGIVIDPRGFILTNHHVVDGVRQINVTMQSGQAYVAQLVARDPETDLAIIRIRTAEPLPIIRLGTSRDLLAGESVIALGNAFGYEHTVTSGIISALHRNVQVNETQQYLDLIQTDASINPGNSGGPLMNVDGEMIGVNVAVRAGAQGIGFAIPVDKALDVAARLMSVESLENHYHGITAASGRPELVVGHVASGSPAAIAGLQRGDVVESVGAIDARRPLDLERALLGHDAGEPVRVVVRRDGQPHELALTLAHRGERIAAKPSAPATPPAAAPPAVAVADDRQPRGEFEQATWESLGLILEPARQESLRGLGLPIDRGMRVIAVRPGSSAASQSVVPGDLLIQVHRWYTTSEQDVRYILRRRQTISQLGSVPFYIIRQGEPFVGQIALSTDRGTTSR